MSLRTEKRPGPLSGYKILDFTRALAGPYATMMLADMGATVIKVEAPDGDFIRSSGPFLDSETHDDGLGGFFNSVNRNKESIVLDLRQPEGQKIAQQLAMECDACISNFSSVGILEKYNLGYDRLHELNPKLVYTVISGYGTDRVVGAVNKERPTVDLMIQAEGGVLSITGADRDHMYKVGPGIGDLFPGALSVIALLGALIRAKDSGEGQYVEVAMMDAIMSLCERMLYQYSYTGVIAEPIGNNHPLQAPWSVYKTADGYISICGSPVKYWDKLVAATDFEPLRAPQFAGAADRVKNVRELNATIEQWTSARTTAECMDALLKYNCQAAPVNNAGDLFKNPHVKAREMLVDIEADGSTGRTVKVAGTPLKFSGTPAKVCRRAPLLGENTKSILSDLGYGEEEIAALVEKGVTKIR